MNCKKCNQELEPGLPFCPACGTDNSVVEKPKKQLWKPVLAVVCLVALIAGSAAAIFFGMGGVFTPEDSAAVKESYTGTDKEVLAAADTVIARAGELELTNGELQIVYWNMVYDFLSYYGDYAYYVLDLSTPLDQQYFSEESGTTFQQYFLEMALDNWLRYNVLAIEATQAGVTLDAEIADYIDGLYENVESQLKTMGFDSVEDMIVHDFGVGGTFDNYTAYLRTYYLGNQYYGQLYDGLGLTDADIEAYYAANEKALDEQGYGKDDGSIVDVRHILIKPSDAEDITTYTEDEWAAAEAEAQRILDLWLQGEADEDSFAALAKEHSGCPSSAEGGLIADVTKGRMVQEFEDWCMDETHEYGDYGIVRTVYGYHIMFYVDGVPLWYDAASYFAASDAMYELLEQQEAQYPLEVNYSKIVLGDVELEG